MQPLAQWYLAQYRNKLSGYVLYDRNVNPHSINIATSIAGVTDAIIVDPSTQLNAQLVGLPLIADTRTMTYAQAYAQYGSQFNRDMLFHQATFHDHHLRDFAVMNRGFTYHTSPTALNPYASNQDAQGRIFGWAHSEFDLFQQASQNNQQVVASDWSWSTSTTSRWKVPVRGQKHHTPGSVTTKPGKHYVAFVMSDGDNAQWLTNGFATDPKWFGSPHRGTFDMTWDFTPSLADMNPVAHNFYYDGASARSEMIALHTEMFGDAYLAKLAEVEASGFTSYVPEPGCIALLVIAQAAKARRIRIIANPANPV